MDMFMKQYGVIISSMSIKFQILSVINMPYSFNKTKDIDK